MKGMLSYSWLFRSMLGTCKPSDFLDRQKDTASFVFSVPVPVKEGMYIRNGARGGQCKGRVGALEHVSHATRTPNDGRMPQ